jgi:hypothetical protein
MSKRYPKIQRNKAAKGMSVKRGNSMISVRARITSSSKDQTLNKIIIIIKLTLFFRESVSITAGWYNNIRTKLRFHQKKHLITSQKPSAAIILWSYQEALGGLRGITHPIEKHVIES